MFRDQKAVLYPCQDTNVLLVSKHREMLAQWYHMVLPAHNVLEMLADKVQFYTYAQKAGFPIPITFFLRERTDAEQAAKELMFPAILKPSTRSPEWLHNTVHKAFMVADEKSLLALYDQYHQWADTLIVQEWIAGTDLNHYACNCYFDLTSKPRVTFTTRKLRQWPPKTGQGCLGEAYLNDVVRDETIRLFQSLDYCGLGYLEMKRDDNSGKYYIIEPNVGRPTGRSATAEAGGVELLYTMYCDATGWPMPANHPQTNGAVKWIYLRQDFQSALHHWRHGNLTVKAWWQSWRGPKTFALFSWRDPWPFIGDILRVIRLLFSAKERQKRNL